MDSSDKIIVNGIEWDITWEELEEQIRANEKQNRTPRPRVYI